MKYLLPTLLFFVVCSTLWSKEIVPKNQEVNAVLVSANTANNQGIKNYNEGRYRLALNSFDDALKGYERIDHQQGLVAVLQSMGLVYFAMGEDTNALNLFQEAMRRSELLDYQKGRGDSFHKLGLVHLERGKYSDAITSFQKATEIYISIKNKEELASTFNSLALCLMSRNQKGDLSLAEDMLGNAIKINRELLNYKAISANFLNLAQIALKEANPRKALQFAENSLDIDKTFEDAKAIGASLNILASIHEKLGNKNLSFFYHERAYATSRALELRNRQLSDLEDLIRLAIDLKLVSKQDFYEKEKLVLLPPYFPTSDNTTKEAYKK